jgi:hypothetical protein
MLLAQLAALADAVSRLPEMQQRAAQAAARAAAVPLRAVDRRYQPPVVPAAGGAAVDAAGMQHGTVTGGHGGQPLSRRGAVSTPGRTPSSVAGSSPHGHEHGHRSPSPPVGSLALLGRCGRR